MPAGSYFAYWGKASPKPFQTVTYHLLPFHALDVAACGAQLLKLQRYSLTALASDLGWSLTQVESVFTCFLALHDLGKFARAFQGLAQDLSPDLVSPNDDKSYKTRHDTLGWWLWREWTEQEQLPEGFSASSKGFWAVWMRCVAGHHGRPPQESEGGGLLQADPSQAFMREDRKAALAFAQDMVNLLLQPVLPLAESGARQLDALKKHAWRLAGLAVLADWLGSNQHYFPYRSQPQSLADYWQITQSQAVRAVADAGLGDAPVRHWAQPQQLFDYLHTPTPLQDYAASVPLQDGPQLFVLEDVTGAGKTEAALMLAQRLMQAGGAHGLYFALPSMATANQMYQRVGQVYQRLYAPDTAPSLVLAHGARQLVEGFSQSVLHPAEQASDRDYQKDERTASAQCNAWLADHRKKALLAEVGVGTIDQALLAVLPARHQSLRLLGLTGKVLLVDEVHAYDEYQMTLLRTLLTAHARQGGSAILLSATLPLDERARLLAAWQAGLGVDAPANLPAVQNDVRYPLAVQAGWQLNTHACETRPQLRRQVQVELVHEESEVLAWIAQEARQGRCVAWIRNTVDDARRAWRALAEGLGQDAVQLFHSRYAMGDRLDIEADVLARFGKHSAAEQRRSRVLIGTQVLEQSLDFDVDAMVSDLAPVDLIIQRAGRLQRHARQADGNPDPDGIERRPPPVLRILTPEPVEAPTADWYASLFPKAKYVYPDAGKLWLGARTLQQAGCIVTPGDVGQPGAVRALVEAVYGADESAVPEGLRAISQKQIGEALGKKSLARFNALQLEMGYCIESSARWYEDEQVPTRLGDETQTLYLALWRDGALHPLRAGDRHAWEQSAVRVAAYRVKALAPSWQQRFASALAELRQKFRLLEEPAFILPLAEVDGGLQAQVLDDKGRELRLRYDRQGGLSW